MQKGKIFLKTNNLKPFLSNYSIPHFLFTFRNLLFSTFKIYIPIYPIHCQKINN